MFQEFLRDHRPSSTKFFDHWKSSAWRGVTQVRMCRHSREVWVHRQLGFHGRTDVQHVLGCFGRSKTNDPSRPRPFIVNECKQTFSFQTIPPKKQANRVGHDLGLKDVLLLLILPPATHPLRRQDLTKALTHWSVRKNKNSSYGGSAPRVLATSVRASSIQEQVVSLGIEIINPPRWTRQHMVPEPHQAALDRSWQGLHVTRFQADPPNLMESSLCKASKNLGVCKKKPGPKRRGFSHLQGVTFENAINFAAKFSLATFCIAHGEESLLHVPQVKLNTKGLKGFTESMVLCFVRRELPPKSLKEHADHPIHLVSSRSRAYAHEIIIERRPNQCCSSDPQAFQGLR